MYVCTLNAGPTNCFSLSKITGKVWHRMRKQHLSFTIAAKHTSELCNEPPAVSPHYLYLYWAKLSQFPPGSNSLIGAQAGELYPSSHLYIRISQSYSFKCKLSVFPLSSYPSHFPAGSEEDEFSSKALWLRLHQEPAAVQRRKYKSK